jgi:hypothetical protein
MDDIPRARDLEAQLSRLTSSSIGLLAAGVATGKHTLGRDFLLPVLQKQLQGMRRNQG